MGPSYNAWGSFTPKGDDDPFPIPLSKKEIEEGNLLRLRDELRRKERRMDNRLSEINGERNKNGFAPLKELPDLREAGSFRRACGT